MRKSEKLIKHLGVALRHAESAENKFACYSLDSIGFSYTDNQRQQMYEAQKKFQEARILVKKIMSEMIGVEIVLEIGSGEWK